MKRYSPTIDQNIVEKKIEARGTESYQYLFQQLSKRNEVIL